MAIKLKSKLLKYPRIHGILEKYILVLIAFICFCLIMSYDNFRNLKSSYTQINSIKSTVSYQKNILESIDKKANLSEISYDNWLSQIAAKGSVNIYNSTKNLTILAEKPQKELNEVSMGLKPANESKDYSRMLKFIIIDKSKGTFITNDVESINSIQSKLNLFSLENGELFNYVSKKGQWYNISYNSQGAPAVRYSGRYLIKNPDNFIEAYWFPKDYSYTDEDSAIALEITDLQKSEIKSNIDLNNNTLGYINKNIIKYASYGSLYLLFFLIASGVLFILGIDKIVLSIKNNPLKKLLNNLMIFFENSSTLLKLTIYFLTSFAAMISVAGILLGFNIFLRLRLVLLTGLVFYLIFILPRIIRYSRYIDTIIYGSEKITSGDLSHTIPEAGDAKLKRLAASINKLNKGFKVSIEDQIKNEKLKSELVANVSHDLKTPLTSIINYTDILLRENISEEEKVEFLKILNRKSLKLKKLIEDLFEISKITSGKVELSKDSVDVVELINQSIAEYSDTDIYHDKNLNFIVKAYSPRIDMNLDGNKMSRVFENIINNAIKYSLKDTRVYVEIESVPKGIKISFKNISSLPLDFDKEEIFERFTRGDKSRNSNIDGNGLGLAIARSIVELHEGVMYIEFDGDLFKSIIELYN